MSKSLALAASLLVAIIALAGATSYTTTVVTTALDEEVNPSRYRECRKQIQGRQFRSCQRYLSRGNYGLGSEEEIEEVVENPRYPEPLKDCCQQLRNVNENCRCEAVRHAVRQLQQGGGSGQQIEKLQEIYQRASNLPSRCGFRQQRCEIRAVFV